MKNGTQVTVISGLGPGDEKRNGEWRYAEAVYEMNGERAAKRPLMAQALCELLPRIRHDGVAVSRVVFVGAPKIEEIWWKSGLLPRGFPGVDVDFVTTPEGKTREEFWEIAGAIAALLEADQHEDPEAQRHYYLDVTPLGYRVMPLFTAAALQQALAGWARKHRRRPPQVTMLYGAWEGKNSDGSMPIWDVTDLVASGNWSSALTQVAQHGRADELALLASTLGGDAAGDTPEQDAPARALADAAQAMARDLTFGRLRDLFTRSVPALLEQLSSDTSQALTARIRTLSATIEEVKANLSPLQASDIVGPEGLRATVAFARASAAQGRYADGAAALREAIVTYYGRSTRRVPMIEPGARGFARQRERITSELNELWRRASGGTDEERAAFLQGLPAALREPLEHLKPLERLRADLGRLGLAEGSSTTNQLRSSFEAQMSQLGALLEGPQPTAIFLNLSDTPITQWTEEQVAATAALGCGEAAELLGGLPELDPDADEEVIEQLARDLASRAVAQGAEGACIDTDPSLTFALVAELQARGIKCYAPTTRKVTEEREVDGVVQKKTALRFARWRPFARPGAEDD
jgi:hypothetical protein